MLTVKQLADEIGVSKVAVNKKIESLGLKAELTKEGNRYLINDAVADKVRKGFKYRTERKEAGQEGTAQDRPSPEQPASDPNAEIIQLLNDTIQVLKDELKEKNRQIEGYQMLLAQQNQLMLTDGRNTPGTQEVEAETVTQEETQTESKEQTQEGKRSFWSRLFG